MAQRFKTQELQLTKQLVIASGDGLLYVNGNPVVAGVSGALNQTGLYLVGQIVATGQSAVIHANGIGSGLSGALSQSGSSILSVIANTGSQAWNAANDNGINLSGNLTQTGATLSARLNALSGFVGQASGGLETRIAQTGQAAVLYASGISGALQGYINSVSGYVIAASGGLETRIVATGTAAINHANSIGQTISGNLTQTGIALNNRVNALSGWVDQGFVHRTGQELISGRKIFVSSPVLTGIEFAGQSGSGIYASVQSDGVVSFAGPSGGLLSIDSGINGSVFAVTDQYESPYLDIYEDGRVYIGNFLSNALFVSGSGVAFGVNYVPTGYNVLISGNTQYIGNVFSGTTGGQTINIADLFYPRLTNPSGYVTGATLVASGSVLYTMLVNASGALVARDNSLSGWVDQGFVHRTGVELISGQKQFLTSPVITGLRFVGPSGSGLFVNAGTGGQIQFNSGENLVMSIDGAISGSLFAVVDESEFPIFEVSSSTKVVAGQFLSNALVVSGSGVSFGTDYVSPNRAILVSGDTEIRGNIIVTGSGVGGYYLSGQNLADILYPRSNPSGYVTGFSLYQTGSSLYNMLTGASGALVTRGNIISGTLATGIALTGSGLYVMLTGASGALNATIQSTGSQAWNAAQNNALNISGNMAQTGATLIARDLVISGVLNTSIAATGQAAVVYASSISGYYRENLTTVTSNYSVLASDRVFLCNNSAPITLTFPSSAVCSGIPFELKIINTGSVYLTGVAGQTFDGQASYTVMGQWQVRKVRPDGSNFYIF